MASLAVLTLGVAGCGGGDKKDSSAPAEPAPSNSAPAATSSHSASEGKAVSSAKVPIVDFKYKPETITVAKGAKVTFTNEDAAPHTATADNGSFETGTLKKGQSKAITLDKAGSFAYYCQFHRFMTGKIIVK